MADGPWRASTDDIKQLYKNRAEVLPAWEDRKRVPICPDCGSRQITIYIDTGYCYRCWADGFKPDYIYAKKKTPRRVYAPRSLDRRFG